MCIPTPESHLKAYLGIPLNGSKPYLAIKKRFLQAERIPKDRKDKIVNLIELLKDSIASLRNSQFQLPSFQSDSPPLNHSSSDSLSQKPDDFEKYLMLTYNQSTETTKRENKLKIILCVFEKAIHDQILEKPLLEKFHRDTLAGALEYHRNSYFDLAYLCAAPQVKPSPLPNSISKPPEKGKLSLRHQLTSRKGFTLIESVHPASDFSDEQADVIKKLSTPTFDLLLSYWFTLVPKLKNEKNDKKFDYNAISTKDSKDKKIIKEYRLYESHNFSEVLQESIIRKFSTQDLAVLGEDLYRQMSVTRVQEKTGRVHTIKDIDNDLRNIFEWRSSEFLAFIKVLLKQLPFSHQSHEEELIFAKFKELKSIENQGFGELCGGFLHFLALAKDESLAKRLFFMLLPFTQQTYMLPGQMIARLFPDFVIKWGTSDEMRRSMTYIFKKDGRSKLKVAVDSSTTKINIFNIILTNTITCNYEDISKSSSKISFMLNSINSKEETYVRDTFNFFGFRVNVKDEIVPQKIKIS